MKKFIKKFVLVLVLATFLFGTISVKPASAQSSWYNQSFGDFYSKVYGSPGNEIFGERYTAAQVQWIFWSIPSFFLDVFTLHNSKLANCFVGITPGGSLDMTDCFSGVIDQVKTVFQNVLNISAINNNENLASLIFKKRSFSGISYVEDKLANFGIVKEVQAQDTGFGFTHLALVAQFWKGARDFSYGVIVVITLVFAFMIMFRTKINPQTVITVQSAIPKIMVALVLVTFSYAIAGFMVDLLYVSIGLVSLLVSSVFGGAYGWFIKSSTSAFHWISGDIPLATGILGSFTILLYFVIYVVLFFASAVLNFVATTLSLSIFGMLISLLMAIASVFIAIILIINFFKVSWMLIKSLLTFYASVIFAPFILAFGALVPSMGFGSWLKMMISSLSAFLLTGTFFVISLEFLMYSFTGVVYVTGGQNFITELLTAAGMGGHEMISSTLWAPPLLATGGEISGLLFLFMSLGIITLLPKVTDIVQGLLSGRPIAYGTAIGEAVMMPVNMVKGSGAYRAYSEYAGTRFAAEVLESKAARTIAGGINTITRGKINAEKTREDISKDIRTRAKKYN